MAGEQDLVIGVDSSTTACKAIAWNAQGDLIVQARAEYALASPQSGWYEQDAEDWWKALCAVLQEITGQVDVQRIAALCITAQRESFVPVDRECQPLRSAILWLDSRAQAEVEALESQVGYAVLHDLTGKGPSINPSLCKIMWLKNHQPDILNRAYKLQEAHGFLAQRLTGQWATSLPCADPMGVVDMRRGDWAHDLLNTLNLDPGLFVDIVPPGSVIGTVTDQAAAATGLRAGTPLVAGAGDGQCAGLGANITAPGRAYLNLGTAAVAGAHTDSYVVDRAFRTLCSPIPGAFVPEAVVSTGTFVVSWFVERFGQDLRELSISAEQALEAEASRIPPGANGLLLVPYWNGVMTPYWDNQASGIMLGWKGIHGRGHFYRAILEGIAFELRLLMDGVSKATGQTFGEYIVMGGGARSDLWCQIVADVTGSKVIRARTTEATNLGAGILAAAAAGWYADMPSAAAAMTATGGVFEPYPDTHVLYSRLFDEVYVTLFPALHSAADRLHALVNPGVESATGEP